MAFIVNIYFENTLNFMLNASRVHHAIQTKKPQSFQLYYSIFIREFTLPSYKFVACAFKNVTARHGLIIFKISFLSSLP
jgi:hypothetical protein